jgi:hypothetical protein
MSSWVIAVDSPGFGGFEMDLIRMLEMTGLKNSAVLCGPILCPELTTCFRTRDIPTFSHSVRNAASDGMGGLIAGTGSTFLLCAITWKLLLSPKEFRIRQASFFSRVRAANGFAQSRLNRV